MTLAGVLLAAVIHVYQTAYNASSRAEAVSIAVLAAESKLAEIGVSIPLQPGETQGRFSSGQRWRVRIVPYGGIAANIRDRLPVEAFEVSVSIFGASGKTDLVTLRTVRLTPRRRDG